MNLKKNIGWLLSGVLSITLYFSIILVDSLPPELLQIGQFGQISIKVFQLVGMLGLPLSIMLFALKSNTVETKIFSYIKNLFSASFSILIFFVAAFSIGIIAFPNENIVSTAFSSHLQIIFGFILLLLVYPFFDSFIKKHSWKIGLVLSILLIFFNQLSLLLVNYFHYSSLFIAASLILFPLSIYVVCLTADKMLFSQRNKLILFICVLLIITMLILLYRQIFLPFSMEKGLLFSISFLHQFLLTPISQFISVIVFCIFRLVKKKTTIFTEYPFVITGLITISSVHFLSLSSKLFQSVFDVQTRFIQLSFHVLLVSLFMCAINLGINYCLYNLINDFKHKKVSRSTIILTGVVNILIINYVINLFVYNFNTETAFSWYQRSFYLLFLNLILLSLFYIFCLTLLNNFWYSNFFFITISLIYAFANYQKILYRNEPITPLDLSNYAALPEIIEMVGAKLILSIVGVLLAIFLVLILLRKKLRTAKVFRIPVRIIGIILVTFSIINIANVTANFKYGNKENFIAQLLEKANFVPHPESLLYNANRNGNLLAFASLTNVQAMRQPRDYTKENIEKLEKKYSDLSVELNKNRQDRLDDETVVFILSESFSDPSNFPTVSLSPDPIPFTKQIMQETTSGKMYSMGYGGGTANIEFEALTSLSMDNFNPAMTTPYLFVVPKRDSLFSINQLFSKSIAIHPYTASTYRRDRAFELLGFDEFYHLGSKKFPIKYQEKKDNSRYISDESAFTETYEHIKNSDGNTFIQLTTMQNHMPYNDGTFKNTISVDGKLTNSSKKKVATFSQGLQYSDQALEQFINNINKLDKPVSIVFYGDHLPAIYDGDATKEKDADLKMHLTDYFIYSNKASKKLNRKIATPNMFAPLLFEQLNQKISPYYALMTDVASTLPAMELQKIFDEDGKQLSPEELTSRQRDLLKDYQLIQYDISAGKNYLSKDFFVIPK